VLGAVWSGNVLVLVLPALIGVGTVLSVPSLSPPVNIISATNPTMLATAPAATARTALGRDHHGPGGGSYSGS